MSNDSYLTSEEKEQGWVEQLAVIKNARFGADDRGGVSLMFDTYMSECVAAGQWIRWDDAYGILSKVQRDTDLNGKTCYVKSNGNMSIFLRMSGI